MDVNSIDVWTLAHLLLGFGLAKFGASRKTNIAFAIGWEFIEPTFAPESNNNQIADIIANVVGYELGKLI